MKYAQLFIGFITGVLSSRTLIWQLVKNELQSRYLGSYLGVLWAFIQPVITVLIFWFVFDIGFKSMPIENFPFILWLVAGMFPWFFIAESLQGATNSVVENSFLVKKVLFRVSILPLIKILSALLIHCFFIILLIGMLWLYGYAPQLIYLQVVYYLFAAMILMTGISWITSSLFIFLKDIGQIVAMMLQFGFWLTPIFWSMKLIPAEYQWFIMLNPAYYIIEGYRNTFIYHKIFWQDGWLAIYYWGVALLLFCGGALLFHRLRPHFADVL